METCALDLRGENACGLLYQGNLDFHCAVCDVTLHFGLPPV